jgi:hypothetical protein
MPRCKDCGSEIVWALTKYGSRVALDMPSEKRYVRVDSECGDPIVVLRDTYSVHYSSEDSSCVTKKS